jgi:hypothetical protein
MSVDKIKIFILIIVGLNFSSFLYGQGDVINEAKLAIKAGSSKELTKYFNESVELGIDGENMNYSKTQAEFVLKDFFKKYPPTDLVYIHQGSSPEGSKYAIGKYSHSGGTFRLFMLVKQVKGVYVIDRLDFGEE